MIELHTVGGHLFAPFEFQGANHKIVQAARLRQTKNHSTTSSSSDNIEGATWCVLNLRTTWSTTTAILF